MEITINLPDKIYEEINEMCVYNNITILEYIFDCVLDNYNTMKHGDLNEKLGIDKEEKVVVSDKVDKVEKRKPGRPRKDKKVEEVQKEVKVVERKDDKTVHNDVEEPVVNKTIKRTRILKSK